MKVKIKRVDKAIDLPQYQTQESAGFDFLCRENITISPKETVIVQANNVIEAPEGFFLAILPRSSTFRKTGLMLANSMGVVDRDYSGPDDEIGLIFHNTTDEEVLVKKGDRLAQGIFIRYKQAQWDEVDEIRDKSRGGFGSTG